jgi:hypothetical protein
LLTFAAALLLVASPVALALSAVGIYERISKRL